MGGQELGPDSLISAATVLMDERGIDQVSTSEIVRVSGHRNRSAIKYHFGSRDELVRTVIFRTMDRINRERNALLDHMEATGSEMSPRAVMEVAVSPSTAQLRTPEGRRHMRVCAQVLDHPRLVSDFRQAFWINDSLGRCVALLLPHLEHLPLQVKAERASNAVAYITRACADQARLLDSDAPARPPLGLDDFTANLVDTVLAMLLAPTTVGSARPR